MKDQIVRILIAGLLTSVLAFLMWVVMFWAGIEMMVAQVTLGEESTVFYEVLGWLSAIFYHYYFIAIPLTFCSWLELINYLAGKNDQQEQ